MFEIQLKTHVNNVKETLNRMGIPDKAKKILYPSCYLIQKPEGIFIAHFKEMIEFFYDGAFNGMVDDDKVRMNSIIFCLRNWGLVEFELDNLGPHYKHVFVLRYEEKQDWKIKHKFNVAFLNAYETETVGI